MWTNRPTYVRAVMTRCAHYTSAPRDNKLVAIDRIVDPEYKKILTCIKIGTNQRIM